MPETADDEAALTGALVKLAREYGRYGYRRVTALLRAEGWMVNHKRVERIWRREGLKVPARQPKRGRLWLNNGSCVRLQPERANHVWAYDFVEDRTRDGRKFRMLTVLKCTRHCSISTRALRSVFEHLHVEQFVAELAVEASLLPIGSVCLLLAISLPIAAGPFAANMGHISP